MSKNMTNKEIAQLFREIAAVFEIKDNNFFRSRAYSIAADSIDKTAIPLKTLYENKELNKIPGIGKNMKSHLIELFEKGSISHFLEESKNIPKGMFPLLTVSGIGPKKAYILSKYFNLNNPKNAKEQLLKYAREDKIRELENFGEKSEKEIIQALVKNRTKNNRMLLINGITISQSLISYLKESESILEAKTLGSLRRRSPTIGDIDIAIATNEPEKAIKHIISFPQIHKVLAKGENTLRILHSSNYQIDIKIQKPKEWGSILQHYTGSKEHNIALRSYAQNKGLSLSEYGIKNSNKTIQFKDEKAFYNFLAMQHIPPELRENKGEIEAALQNKLPNLVKLSDIKGDFHIHTNIDIKTSHDEGLNSVSEILKKASSLNYYYIGLTDHNPKISDLTLKDRLDLIKKRNEIILKETEKFNSSAKTKIHVYKGLEVDIRPNGELAIEDRVIDELDYIIVSIHSQFSQKESLATQRVLRALSHPKAKILGHPRGQLLEERVGLTYTWELLFDFCQKNNKILEINATPYRADLSDNLIREAIENDITLIINTDSHDIKNMDLIKYGVWQARRGWAEKKSILNTWNWEDLDRLLI